MLLDKSLVTLLVILQVLLIRLIWLKLLRQLLTLLTSTFVSANTGYTEIRTDSTNLKYNPSTNRLTVNNFRSTTDFEVQGNLTITGNILYGQAQVGSIANHDTDALAEGVTNLYFTDERVDDRVAGLINAGTGISATYDDAGNMLHCLPSKQI